MISSFLRVKPVGVPDRANRLRPGPDQECRRHGAGLARGHWDGSAAVATAASLTHGTRTARQIGSSEDGERAVSENRPLVRRMALAETPEIANLGLIAEPVPYSLVRRSWMKLWVSQFEHYDQATLRQIEGVPDCQLSRIAIGVPDCQSVLFFHQGELMRVITWIVATLVACGFSCASAESGPLPALLKIAGRTTIVQNTTHLQVSVTPGFQMTGPHSFRKEDNGFHFEATLQSYVSADSVISVVAERLVESSKLNYDDLPKATWPDAGFLTRASGCTQMTPDQAKAFPAESGMSWILDAGFEANGTFAFEASLLMASDGRHEATIELIVPVSSCDDAAAIASALASLRKQITVKN